MSDLADRILAAQRKAAAERAASPATLSDLLSDEARLKIETATKAANVILGADGWVAQRLAEDLKELQSAAEDAAKREKEIRRREDLRRRILAAHRRDREWALSLGPGASVTVVLPADLSPSPPAPDAVEWGEIRAKLPTRRTRHRHRRLDLANSEAAKLPPVLTDWDVT